MVVGEGVSDAICEGIGDASVCEGVGDAVSKGVGDVSGLPFSASIRCWACKTAKGIEISPIFVCFVDYNTNDLLEIWDYHSTSFFWEKPCWLTDQDSSMWFVSAGQIANAVPRKCHILVATPVHSSC